MLQNRIVAGYLDGRRLKGDTGDFLPTKPSFHLTPADTPPASPPVEVWIGQLKAVFFVKDLAGASHPHPRRQEFASGKPVVGRKVRVVFRDGELLVGTTQGYDPKRQGFFVFPADPDTNNERIFVVAGATQQVTFV